MKPGSGVIQSSENRYRVCRFWPGEFLFTLAPPQASVLVTTNEQRPRTIRTH